MTQLCYITTCKGRLKHLQQSLPRIVEQHNVSCVVVDYCCPDGAANWVEKNYPQVKVVRVTDEAGFNLVRARNLGACEARAPWFGFFDADILLDSTFSENVVPKLTTGHFYRASPVTPQTWGSIICSSDDFWRLGGYDEVYQGWGCEDDDFIAMLEQSGTRAASFSASLLSEIPHTDELRTRFYEIKDLLLQQCINHTYKQVKFDVLRLHGQPLQAEQAKSLYFRIRAGILAADSNISDRPGTIDVDLPLVMIYGPAGEAGKGEGVLRRKLNYQLELKRANRSEAELCAQK